MNRPTTPVPCKHTLRLMCDLLRFLVGPGVKDGYQQTKSCRTDAAKPWNQEGTATKNGLAGLAKLISTPEPCVYP